jgi:hypothetical protein
MKRLLNLVLRRESAKQRVTSRGGSLRSCSCCGRASLREWPGEPVEFNVRAPLSLTREPGMPVIPMVCVGCGHIELFSAAVLDLN